MKYYFTKSFYVLFYLYMTVIYQCLNKNFNRRCCNFNINTILLIVNTYLWYLLIEKYVLIKYLVETTLIILNDFNFFTDKCTLIFEIFEIFEKVINL